MTWANILCQPVDRKTTGLLKARSTQGHIMDCDTAGSCFTPKSSEILFECAIPGLSLGR